jgi:dihydrolipoamide dehydrogenase
MEFEGKKFEELYERVLVSVGRVPNTEDLGLKSTNVQLDAKGFIKVNSMQQTDETLRIELHIGALKRLKKRALR